MTQFTGYRDSFREHHPVVVETDMSKEIMEDPHKANDATCAIFIMLYTNYFAITRCYEEFDRIKNAPKDWMRGKLKTAVTNFMSAIQSKDHFIQKSIYKNFPGDFADAFATLCDSIEDDIKPLYDQLRNAIRDVIYADDKIEHKDEVVAIFTMDLIVTIAEQTIVNLTNGLEYLKDGVSRIDMRVAYERGSLMCDLTSKSVHTSRVIDFNKELTVRSKINTIMKKLRDGDIFSKAFIAGGWALEYENIAQ